MAVGNNKLLGSFPDGFEGVEEFEWWCQGGKMVVLGWENGGN